MHKQQKIEKALMQRFAHDDVEQAIFRKRRVMAREPQFLDVKHMSEIVARYRHQTRIAVQAARLMRQLQNNQRDALETVFLGFEAAVLKRRLGDCLQLWYIAHKDYHTMRRTYLAMCMATRDGIASQPKLKRRWDDAA